FNMFLLFLIGRELEPQLGSGRFAALYGAALLAGAAGALLFEPNAVTVGASGAIFGIMGAAVAILWRRGVNPFQTDIGMLIVFNLVLGFVIPNVSIGGHLGGLAGGVFAGLGIAVAQERRAAWIGWLSCLVVAVVSVVGAELLVRSGTGGLGV
ncbi:MAG: rhomboid family intramembrane serine protease, partial [Actinobacteria bacterium]|nr:rhomboid family intramembrane serine protease [Actinomycetota bacterium]